MTPHVGDTRWPEGVGSGGSNTTNSVAPAVRLAAHDARQKLFAVAAPLLGAKAEDLDAAGGKIFVAASPRSRSASARPRPRCRTRSSAAVAERKKQYETYRQDLAGTQFAEVEVDTETGNIRVHQDRLRQRLRDPDQHPDHGEPDHRRP